MKRVYNFVAIALSAAIISGCTEVKQPSEVVLREGLQYNESTLPYDGGLLIANFGTTELNSLNSEGEGYIAYLKDGEISTFIPADGALSAPKGMLVLDGFLLICDVNRVVAYNLSEPNSTPQIVHFPEGELFVNDIVANGSEIYISVTNSGNIFKLDGAELGDLSAVEPILWSSVVGANGLLLVNDRLYVASYPANGVTTPQNVIYQITNLLEPTPEPLTSQAGQWDGLAISADQSTLYASSWAPKAEVVAIDLASGEIAALVFENEFIGAADFSLIDGVLYIPDLPNSQLIIKEL